MPRHREFDPKEALQIAIFLFWEKGYYDTSVDEIVKQSGVAKYGIYGTFGTKRELFIKVLSQYGSDRHKDIQRPIRKPDASLPDVIEFFDALPRILTQKNSQYGCLMANTGIELGMRDAEISNIVKEFFSETASAMRLCLDRAIDRGELLTNLNINQLSKYLVTEFRTALVLAASGCSSRQIKQHLEIALQVLV